MRQTATAHSQRRYKCRNTFCGNRYDDVIGGENAFGSNKAGGVCIPCLYAEQMARQGQTIEQVEAVPKLLSMFTDLLQKTGWTWEHLKASFELHRKRTVQ